MIFDRYEHLSEDAQRLLCFFVDTGLGSEKRMDEHIYLLTQYCFTAFDGQSALEELLREGILKHEGKDWYANMPRYGINDADFVPALWYLYECRKDLLLSFRKFHQMGGTQYRSVRYAVKQLVDSGYQMCDGASCIEKEQTSFFFSVAAEPRFLRLLENLSPETFVCFFEGVCEYLVVNDVVADTSSMLVAIEGYAAITEATRCRLIAEIELYEYISTGKMPANGIYDKFSAGYVLFALRCLYEGRYADSAKWFSVALKALAKERGRQGFFSNPLLDFYMVLSFVAVISENKDGHETVVEACRTRLREFIANLEVRADERLVPARVLAEDCCQVNMVLHKERVLKLYATASAVPAHTVLCPLVFLLANHLGYSTAGMEIARCTPRLALLQHEMCQCLPFYDEEREQLRRRFGQLQILASIYHKAEWESVLEGLMADADEGVLSEERDVRLMYLRESSDSPVLQVREQTRLKNGSWGSGKRVNESRYRKGLVECMNNADRRILARLNHSRQGVLLLEHVIEEMVDDSRLYAGSSAPYERVQVNRDKPYLVIENDGGSFVVKSNVPEGHVKDDFVIVEETPTQYSLIHIPNDIREYYIKLLQLGHLPLEAEGTLRSLLEKIGGRVELHSSLIEGGSTLPLVDGEWRVGFKLSPKNSGTWNVKCFVRPLPGGRRSYRLGEGSDIIIDENAEGRVRVQRNMPMEQSQLELVRSFWDSHGYDYEESVAYPPEFLLHLVQLIQSQPDTFYAEWPEGRSFKVKTLTRGASTWSGVLRDRGHWFDIEGDVLIDEQTRLSIAQLLELASQSEGRFVQINEQEYLLLSEELKRQLTALDAVVCRERGKYMISPFSAALMGDDLLHGAIDLQADAKLSDIKQRILDSSTYSPSVPTELTATLRPYQIEGYQWIARLNSWGAGALLADDMGLGKTLQTIAFLLLKQAEGPSLVVAPASVAPNWKTEIERFAPTLRVHILNYAADRQQLISQAAAGDVVVTTYGILLSVQDALTQKQWNVACLDEAHIIKNRGAKTSAAAMKIQASNRVMLTGTPVQNHLGELWSLFQFVNPGLLGSYEHFSRKFIQPIENHHDPERQQQLDHLVHPFMLRRTKQAVLAELPEKTEIYHAVELSREELAVYESLRQRTEQMLAQSDSRVDLHVLAQITRLRQAACSVQLIEPKWTGESSKIIVLAELLQGVIEAGHRALVFSQFVSFFHLVRAELDRRGMPYYYIDGSTPMSLRADMVQSFQSGHRPLFLISLKAGGLGLNLTGANYVFHLDPWWNPAVEQQATDRAHRIGQTQAVTVYHLVSKHTIEEKIIRLHQAKRQLATDLLEGTDASYKLTGKELLEMVSK